MRPSPRSSPESPPHLRKPPLPRVVAPSPSPAPGNHGSSAHHYVCLFQSFAQTPSHTSSSFVSDFFLSLGIVFLSFLRVVPRTASLAPVYRRVCVFSIFFIFSPVDGHSGCFQVGATMRTKAAVDIHIGVLVRRSVFASPG